MLYLIFSIGKKETWCVKIRNNSVLTSKIWNSRLRTDNNNRIYFPINLIASSFHVKKIKYLLMKQFTFFWFSFLSFIYINRLSLLYPCFNHSIFMTPEPNSKFPIIIIICPNLLMLLRIKILFIQKLLIILTELNIKKQIIF